MNAKLLAIAASLKKALSENWGRGDLSRFEWFLVACGLAVVAGSFHSGVLIERERGGRRVEKALAVEETRGELADACALPGMWGVTGACSTFGGPKDATLSKAEGLALVDSGDASRWWFRHLFLDAAGTGKARELNPEAFYVACRWNYAETPRRALRWAVARVAFGGRSIYVRCIDWGPAERTGRDVDLSPGAARALGVVTGDVVTVQVFLP